MHTVNLEGKKHTHTTYTVQNVSIKHVRFSSMLKKLTGF